MAEGEIMFRLTDEEYQEFVRWFSYKFYRGKGREKITFLLSNLKAETHIQMESYGLHIQSGQKNLKLLYSVLEKLDCTEHLILFFAWKEFWAVPKRVLGDEAAGEAWFGQLKERCESGASARVPLMNIEERCRAEGVYCRCYTRTVDQVLEAYGDLGKAKKELMRLRELTVFPYRYTGVQVLALESDGLYEYSERSVAVHRYGDLERAVYSDMCLYLIKGDGEEILVPLYCLGDGKEIPVPLDSLGAREEMPVPPDNLRAGEGISGTEHMGFAEGMEHFLALCNEKRPSGRPALCPEKLDMPKLQGSKRKNLDKQSAGEPEKVIVLQPHRRRGKGRRARVSQRNNLFKRRKNKADFCGIGNPVSGYVLIGTAALITAVIAVWGPRVVADLRADGRLDYFYRDIMHWGGARYAGIASAVEEELPGWEEELSAEAEKYKDGSGIDHTWKEQYMITVPDDTVFDQVTGDGTYVSSGQFFSIKLPLEKWEKSMDLEHDDILSSSWGTVSVSGFRDERNPYMMVGTSVPKTKAAYLERMNDPAWGGTSYQPEVVEYTYEDDAGCVIVEKELRRGNGIQGYSLELSLMSPEYFYTVTIGLKEETQENIRKARECLDSFRILNTSTGICRQMEEATFHGYYGKNYVMASCLVHLERDMTEDEIGKCLERVKDIDKGFLGSRDGDALAVRKEGSSWLGIDSPSLQENCYKENARKVSEIFQSEVILYDEFDGDLLMVAYSDKEQRQVYQRATSFDKTVLEEEFGCYGEEQKFPEDLLKYMDLTKEEAAAVWEDREAVFQMDKWEELVSHMTKMPVPREFIGVWDYEAFGDGFEVIRR